MDDIAIAILVVLLLLSLTLSPSPPAWRLAPPDSKRRAALSVEGRGEGGGEGSAGVVNWSGDINKE